MSDELLGVIQVSLGCGNDASLGNLLTRFPQFPQASSSILDYYQFFKRKEGGGKLLLDKLFKIRELKENCQKTFDNNYFIIRRIG